MPGEGAPRTGIWLLALVPLALTLGAAPPGGGGWGDPRDGPGWAEFSKD